jgi:hypothetical protein
MSHVSVWDTETVPDLKGFAAAHRVSGTAHLIRPSLKNLRNKHAHLAADHGPSPSISRPSIRIEQELSTDPNAASASLNCCAALCSKLMWWTTPAPSNALPVR